MTEDDKKKFISWLEEKWPNEKRPCEVCGLLHWQLSSDITTPMVFYGNMVHFGNAYPKFMVICTNCGNTKYFNAVIAGVLKNSEKEEMSNTSYLQVPKATIKHIESLLDKAINLGARRPNYFTLFGVVYLVFSIVFSVVSTAMGPVLNFTPPGFIGLLDTLGAILILIGYARDKADTIYIEEVQKLIKEIKLADLRSKSEDIIN